jgi:hypothetical protein
LTEPGSSRGHSPPAPNLLAISAFKASGYAGSSLSCFQHYVPLFSLLFSALILKLPCLIMADDMSAVKSVEGCLVSQDQSTLTSGPRDCEACREFRNRNDPESTFRWDELCRAASSGCQLCSILHSAVSAFLDNDDQVTHVRVSPPHRSEDVTYIYNDIFIVQYDTRKRYQYLELYTLNSQCLLSGFYPSPPNKVIPNFNRTYYIQH